MSSLQQAEVLLFNLKHRLRLSKSELISIIAGVEFDMKKRETFKRLTNEIAQLSKAVYRQRKTVEEYKANSSHLTSSSIHEYTSKKHRRGKK